MKPLPIKILCPRLPMPHDGIKVIMDQPLFGSMVRNRTIVELEAMFVVFSSPRINPHMEELSVSIALSDICDPCTLFFPGSLNNGEGNNFPLEPRPEISL